MRLNINTVSFNGVFISCGEEVIVLAEDSDADGVAFCQVSYGKKKGWLKTEHLQ